MRAFLPVMLLMAAGSSARAECSGFKDGAETFAKASFHTRFTRKGSKTDYKRAVVEWDPASMLDDLGCYEIENTELMYKVSSNILLEKNRYFSLSGQDTAFQNRVATLTKSFVFHLKMACNFCQGVSEIVSKV